jgi:hypothetical protein
MGWHMICQRSIAVVVIIIIIIIIIIFSSLSCSVRAVDQCAVGIGYAANV